MLRQATNTNSQNQQFIIKRWFHFVFGWLCDERFLWSCTNQKSWIQKIERILRKHTNKKVGKTERIKNFQSASGNGLVKLIVLPCVVILQPIAHWKFLGQIYTKEQSHISQILGNKNIQQKPQ